MNLRPITLALIVACFAGPSFGVPPAPPLLAVPLPPAPPLIDPAPARADGEAHPDGGGWRWSAAWGCWYRVRPLALPAAPAGLPVYQPGPRPAGPLTLAVPRGGVACPT